MNIDRSILIVVVLLGFGFITAFYVGLRIARNSKELPYFLMRRSELVRGWQWIGIAAFLGFLAIITQSFGREAVYIVFPPTPSLTPTGTQTQTPTITLTPTISPTPSITPPATVTYTPTVSSTPALPADLTVLLQETTTPNPDAAFSQIVFSRQINNSIQPVSPSDAFTNPVPRLYGAFSYNNLTDGVRWSAIWQHEEMGIVCVESQIWNGGTGGYGYTECEPDIWYPGEYVVQLFFAETWEVSGRFTIVGNPPTATATPQPDTNGN
ncbi:MAG: hypothetical protein JXA97_13960 [Anaerolineales bacterium]|nr:hypothetical protein [Anaerolineales bacterium]